jgi:hypothetical protein
MNSRRTSVLNPLIGVGLLLLTAFTLTSPRMRDYYALHHVSNATLYGVAIFRVIIAGSLILGRGRRVVLALRYGVLALVVAFSLLPPGMKPLAPLICLSVVVLVFAATQTRDAPGPQSSSRSAGSATGASAGPVIASLVLAGVLGISAVMAFLDPRYNAAFDNAGYPANFGNVVSCINLLAALLLCLPPARRLALGGFGAYALASVMLNCLYCQLTQAGIMAVMFAFCVGPLAATQPKPA